MGGDAFVVVFFKPEIATGYFKFTSSGGANPPDDGDSTAIPSAAPSSSIPGVSAVEAAFLLPNGHIIPTVMARIKDKGFELVQRRMKQLTRAEARYLFSFELQHRFRDDEQAFAAFLAAVTNGPSLVLLLKLPDTMAKGDANAAIKKWIELAGDWDPVVARKKALAGSIPHDQWPLRALCGLNTIQNGIASSPHACCSRRERFFLFPPAVPQLERATIVLLPSFHSNFPDGKDILLSTLGVEVRAVVVDSRNGCALSGDEAIALCGLTRVFDKGPGQQACENVIQLMEQSVDGKGVDVLVLEGLDLSYLLRSALGPANVDLARLYFPESVRGQVPSKLPSVDLPAGLTPNEMADDDALGFESGLFISFDPKLNIGHTTEALVGAPQQGMQIEYTLGLIKPNAACKPDVVAEILRMISFFGFTVECQRRLLLSRDQAGAFYSEHHGKPFYETLLGFMTSGEIVALKLSRTFAIKAWRALMGPTNSTRARETHPWTLRARFGVDGTHNATHGSDSSVSAARELCFFFGSAISASAATRLFGAACASVQTIAQRPMVNESSIEKILSQGLKELVDRKVSNPLEACRWLGEWLITYRSRGLQEEPEVHEESRKAKLTSVNRKLQETKDAHVRKVVALTLDATINHALRSALFGILCERLEESRYKVIDVATELRKFAAVDVGVASIVRNLKECGRRRCVLFGCDDLTGSSMFHREFKAQAPSDWHINYVVHVDSHLSNGAPKSIKPSPSLEIPIFHFSLPSTLPSDPNEIKNDGALDGLFRAVFDPNVVLLLDPQKLVSVEVWNVVANQFGFFLLTFDALIAKLKTSNDTSKNTRVLLELLSSGSTIPSTLILTILRRAILGCVPGGNVCTQKFVLLGFPFQDIQATELEQAIGRPQGVLLVGDRNHKFTAKTSTSDPPTWMAAFSKKGLVKRVWIDSNGNVDRNAVSNSLHGALAPVVGCFLGKCDSIEQLQTLQTVAKSQGYIWVDCCATSGASTVQNLSQLLLRGHAGREKFLLYGYPQLPAQVTEFFNGMGAPQFMIHDSASPVAHELLAAFDAHPTITQLDLASSSDAQTSNGPSKLRSTFFRKHVVVVTGSTSTLDLRQLRDVVAPLGYDVIDFQLNDANLVDEHKQTREFERRVQAVQARRCLVVGLPETPSFYHALEAHIGCAMHKILVLQRVPVRVRAPDAMDDDDLDDYSDEEQSHLQIDENSSGEEDSPLQIGGGIKWRKVMQALSPQLSQLVQTFASSSTSLISLDVLGFLETASYNSTRLVQNIVARLRPRLFGVVGNPFSFYKTAARCFCRRHLIGFVDLHHFSSSSQVLEALESLIANTPHSTYCLDGFPCSSYPDDITPSRPSSSSPPRYVSQQLWELDRRLGTFTSLIHFTTALEVLEERTPEHVTRRMLDLAQDELELSSGDLVSWLRTGKNRHQTITEVSCDRTLEDAQEELATALQRALRPSRPAIKQKGG